MVGGGEDSRRSVGEAKTQGQGASLRRHLTVRPAILAVLLVTLVGYALSGAIRGAHGAGPSTCSHGTAPVTLRMEAQEVTSMVRASRLRWLVGGGAVDVQGFQEPSSTWTDTAPSPPAGDSAHGAIDAGYEIRWWSPEADHQVADMFVFARSTDATRYVLSAASARCRPEARSYRLSAPSGARALVWTNPDGAREVDVFVARGNHAYRLVDVPPSTYLQGPLRLTTWELLAVPQGLACRLAQVHCRRVSPQLALSGAGYDAMKLLAAAEWLLRFEPGARGSAELGRTCALIGHFSDPESRTLFQWCQVTLHFLDDEAYAARCDGASPCQQWSINTAVADLHRSAAIERQLSARLLPGACRLALTYDAAHHDRLAEAFHLYGLALTAPSPRLRRLEQIRSRVLARPTQRHGMSPLSALSACRSPGESGALSAQA